MHICTGISSEIYALERITAGQSRLGFLPSSDGWKPRPIPGKFQTLTDLIKSHGLVENR